MRRWRCGWLRILHFFEGYRNRLAKNRLTHPLFDTDRFRRHIEAAYLQMWEIWQRGEQPRSFAVEAERDVKVHDV